MSPNSNEVRRRYLKKLNEKTNPNTVRCYSGWLQKTGARFSDVTGITDDDEAGFTSCFHGLDASLGLDLPPRNPGAACRLPNSSDVSYVQNRMRQSRIFRTLPLNWN